MQANIDLQGLRVGITGGTSGLGLALVRQLAEKGASIAFVARTAANVGRVAAETGAQPAPKPLAPRRDGRLEPKPRKGAARHRGIGAWRSHR
ncbi:short-chain dehydrogenase/reductase SDR family domain-containing protein (plasmid) [Rhizobium etli bv. mimosae str. IE4771]|uniref:Short-chain dehydrogenase/reductase SDR family domain-containing protein n=1 Tax=Rhizobium etli bv. mimosae str. IE4771 TaxID=1432050 RepID=A0A060IHM6_RHIET|nr:SDR family NAD(P)-dependent oxidoreductase [Rhizobium sp. IE4771]AIC31450.1 short-chain dehydrogenase/reductase SDR family domain-containing protein [Rhizobium sp. IE4771]